MKQKTKQLDVQRIWIIITLVLSIFAIVISLGGLRGRSLQSEAKRPYSEINQTSSTGSSSAGAPLPSHNPSANWSEYTY
jgi:hypothetical protein